MQRIAKPAEILEIGQVVDARIIDIDDEKQKVSLSIRSLLEEAASAAEAMPEDYEAAEETVADDQQ
jgi:4-hydroxy-3-methylbut-2-enyl diphosphate reductase